MAGYSFADVLRFENEKRQTRVHGNDSMTKREGKIDIAYRGNRIATWNPETRKMMISSAGWMTNTTRDRLNKIIPAGYVSQFLGDWYYVGDNNMAVPFEDNMVANPNIQGIPFDDIRKQKKQEYAKERREMQKREKAEQRERETEFATITPEGKKVDVHRIDLSKVQSDDPLAFSFGLTQGIAGRRMEKAQEGDKLAPEYIRGYKQGRAEFLAKQQKKMNPFTSKKSQMPMTMTKVPKFGSKGSGWHKEPISHSYARKNGKAPARVRGR